MAKLLRFGILGTGNIAGQFADGVRGARGSVVTAVGSRSAANAAAFGERFGLPPENCHGDYHALVENDEVDAVYVSLPNHRHAEWTIRSLEAGKHVLCEKPFAMDTREAQRMFETADRVGRRVMEAFMYRCHPLTRGVVEAVRGGAIGEVRLVRTSFCYATKRIAGNVRFDPAMGGGGLMDIGSYCVDFCRLIAGREPSHAHLVGHTHETGVDDYATGVLKFPADPRVPAAAQEITATLSFGMTVQANNTALIGGTEGYLEIPVPWKPPAENAVYLLHGQTPPRQDADSTAKPGPPEPQTFMYNATAPLYGMEADAFAHCLQTQRPFPVTPADTLGNMRLLDRLRAQLASVSPGDGPPL
ncbi:MAG: Gfo/Idh/MocA family oxidoreductase [Planctomycetota bacterium]